MLKEIFQFIPANNSSLEKFLVHPVPQKVSFIFDLEDSIQDVIHPERTPGLKNEARIKLLTLLQSRNFKNTNNKFGIRINSIHGKEFHKDLKFLVAISQLLPLHYLVIPKLNTGIEHRDYLNAFSKNNILFEEMIPIIETGRGFRNLGDIFSRPPSAQFHRAFWGHQDYNLDEGIFPFIEHRSEKYWKLTEHIITKLKDSGYGFCNGAFLELNNDNFLAGIINAISFLCKKDFDSAALSLSQVELLLSFQFVQPIHYSELIDEQILNEEEKKSVAEATIEQFRKNQLKEKSFSLDKNDCIIITPQVYLAAVKYLEQVVHVHD